MLLKIEAHNRDMEEILVTTLYLRNMENYQGVILLAEKGMIAQGKMLTRCMFDCVFPLCAISNDKEHKIFIDYIQVDLLHRRKFTRKYKNLSTAKQKYLEEIDEIEDQLTKDI